MERRTKEVDNAIRLCERGLHRMRKVEPKGKRSVAEACVVENENMEISEARQ